MLPWAACIPPTQFDCQASSSPKSQRKKLTLQVYRRVPRNQTNAWRLVSSTKTGMRWRSCFAVIRDWYEELRLRILGDASEADDLLQDVFLFVHRKVSVFDPSKASFRSWIVQMTYQRAIDRRRYLHSRHFYTHLDLAGADEIVDHHREGREEDELLSGPVGNATIRGLLDTLTEDQRDTLTLHFFEGYTFDEIALKLGQSFGNIRNHYYRGLDKLRKQMFPGKLSSLKGYGRK